MINANDFALTERDVERKRELGIILKEIHRNIPSISIDTSKVGNHEIRKGFMGDSKLKRLIIYLRSSGCQWMLTDENGGCTMCGHLAGTTCGKAITAAEFQAQFESIISKYVYTSIPTVCVYNAGSFFNDNEVPAAAREYIFRRLDSISEIKHVIFESRPEHLTEDKIMAMRNLLPGKRIEIGIGLESSDEYIRQMCLNKGFRVTDFLMAITLLKRYGVYSIAYVIHKPPFVAESTAIYNSIRTIKWAFQNGVDVISLEPLSVQKNTLVHLLYSINAFRPPWVWSVLQVVSQTGNLGVVRIGGFEFFPPPAVCTHNCISCDEFCANSIERYNATSDLDIISAALAMQCTCKFDWLQELKKEKPIKEAIDDFLSSLNFEQIPALLQNELRNFQ